MSLVLNVENGDSTDSRVVVGSCFIIFKEFMTFVGMFFKFVGRAFSCGTGMGGEWGGYIRIFVYLGIIREYNTV